MTQPASSTTTPMAPWETDRYGRRLVPDPDTGELTPYQRTSSFAETLSDGGGLGTWQAWCALRGAQSLPDVAAEVVASPSAPKLLLERLSEAGGSKDAANRGTDRHQIVAMALLGESLPPLPDEARSELEAILGLLQDLGEIVCVEGSVVNDRYRCAGSVDYVLRARDGGTVVADLKTGKSIRRLSAGIQLVTHARGQYWDPDLGRTAFVAETRPRLVVIHAPQTGKQPTLIDIDPDHATEWADLAVQVRETRKNAERKPA